MSEISRVALFGKLDPTLYKAIEGATVLAKLRGNPYVELVHWINQILQLQDSDLHRIVRHFDLDAARLAADVTAADVAKARETVRPSLDPAQVQSLREFANGR